MKKFIIALSILCLAVPAYARDLPASRAKQIRIVDDGDYYTGTQVEDALQEIGAGGIGDAAPKDAKYITQTTNATLTAEQALTGLSDGMLKVDGTTGVLSNATAGADYIETEVDGSVTNEINTITTPDTEVTAGLAITFADTGIMTITESADTITFDATEVDGSTSNEINTITAGDANATAGLAITFVDAGIISTTEAGDSITITATEAQDLDAVLTIGDTADTENIVLTTGSVTVGDDYYVGAVGLNDNTSGAAGCSLIGIPVLNTPTWTTQCEFDNLFGSPGRATGGATTDAASENINTTAGTGFIKATDDDTAELLSMDWAAANGVATTTDSHQYVGVIYDGGTPSIDLRNAEDYDLDTEFVLSSVVNEGGTLHILNNPWWVTDGMTNIVERFRAEGYIVRDENIGGLVLSVPGTRNVAVTAGTLWSNLNEFVIPALDTNVPLVASHSATFDVDNGSSKGTITAGSGTPYSVLSAGDKIFINGTGDNDGYEKIDSIAGDNVITTTDIIAGTDGVEAATVLSPTIEIYSYTSSTWSDTNVMQYPITQWNDLTGDTGAGTLETIGNNKYFNWWVYSEADDLEVAMVYPQAEYVSAAGAEAESPPTSIPTHIAAHGILIGRILCQQGVDAPVQVDTAWETTFTASQAADHANLANLTWTSSVHSGTADSIAGFATTTGAAFEVNTFAELNTIIADKTLINEEDAVIFDSTVNIIGTTTLGTATSAAGNLTLYDEGLLTLYEDGDNFSVTMDCQDGEAVMDLQGGLDVSGVITSTSPVFTTPNLGTPSTLVLTNATGLPAAAVLTGTFGTGAYTMDTSLAVPIVDTPLIQDAATIHLRPSGDADDYVTVKTATNISYIGRDDDDDLIKLEANAVTIAGTITATGLSGSNTGDNTVATSGDAAVDFFGAGVTAVTDATTCTDIEGTSLSIATGTLNVDDDFLKLGGDIATAGTYDFGSASVVLEVPNAEAPTTNATGEMAIDTNLLTQGVLQVYLASAIANVVATTDTPGDNEVPTYDAGGGTIQWEAGGSGGASTALDNLASVAISESLISDAADTDSLGSATYEWLNAYIGDAGKIYLGLGQDTSINRSAANTLTFTASSGALFSGKVTAVGSFDIGDATVNETDLEKLESTTSTHTQLNYLSASTGTTGTTNTNLVFSTSPTFVTPILGTPQSGTLTNCDGTASSLTAGAVTGFTPASGSLTLAGADAVTITTTGATNSTLPLGTKTLVATDVATLSSLTSIGTLTSLDVTGTITSGTSTSAAGAITLYDKGILTFNDDGGGNSVTMNCNDSEDVLLLTGGLDVTGALTATLTGSSTSCTGESATVATITGLAPDTQNTYSRTQYLIPYASTTTAFGEIAIGTDSWVLTSAGAGAAPAFEAIPTLNQNTTGTAANLSGTPALPNGTTATTQSAADNSTKLATTAYADAAAAGGGATTTLNNLGSVAVNTDIISDAADTDSLGSATYEWLNFYLGDAGKFYLGLGQDTSIERSAANEMTLTATSGVTVESVKHDGGVVSGISANIKDMPQYLRFTIIDPLSVQTEDNEICLIPVTDAAFDVTKIVVTLDAAANEVLGDLKYADTFIGLGSPAVINDFDTTSGVRSDSSITSADVPASKCLYIAFDSAPDTAIKQMCVEITYNYD